MNKEISLTEKTMQEIKYQQGFNDALVFVYQILTNLSEMVVLRYKQNQCNLIPKIIAQALEKIAEVWNESNKRTNRYIDELQTKHGIEYDFETEKLVFEEDTGVLKVEKIKEE